MALIPLKLPPGVYKNGTEFEQSNRWRDASLVRWSEGSMRPVGGWTDFVTSGIAAPPRGMHGWRDLDANNNLAAGTYEKLYAISSAGTVTDITPTSFTLGRESATQNTGYGGGLYNVGSYSTPRVPSANWLPATTWAIDNFGEDLVACSSTDGKLHLWDVDGGGVAAPITNAPIGNQSLIVTEERFLFALGADNNPRKIQWCDKENLTSWTPAATNEAGDIELQSSGTIRSAIRIRGRTLIITDVDAHLATYQGPPYVYGFERVGSACGTDSPKSLVAVDQAAFWMGQKGFFFFDGSIVKELNCEVSDHIFRDINTNQISKVYATHNSRFSEIWWFYASEDSTENNRYVSYDYKDNIWMIGELSRTAAIDTGILRYPIWAGPNGELYFQEYGFNHDGATQFVESGPISLGNGDNIMHVTDLIPDELTQGDVNAKFKTRFYPNGTESEFGSFTMANPTNVRFSGRQVRMRVETTVNNDWRVGTMRIEAKAGGKR
jgi:hypothetical protein